MTSCNYLNAEQVLFIHKRIIDETGGARGVRDVGALQSAIARPQATFDQVALFPDIFSKAAALMHDIILNHPFVDGNKRTGFGAATIFLLFNDKKLKASHSELETYVLEVATGRHTVDEIASWLRAHTEDG